MPKLLGNNLGKFKKRCSAPHHESRKIEFAFFLFFYDFLEILQDSAIWIHYRRCTFTPRTLQRSKVSQPCPRFADNTLERKRALQLGPWQGEAAPSVVFRRAGGAPGWGGNEAWPHAHLGRRGGRGLSGGGSGDLGRRRWAVPAAAAWLPARRRRGWCKAWLGEVQ
jgi:hypothetical protein